MKYVLKMQDDEIVTCDSCGCEAPTAEFDNHMDTPRDLCEFCSTTMASRITEYPAPNEHIALKQEVWKAAASVFNMIKYPNEEK